MVWSARPNGTAVVGSALEFNGGLELHADGWFLARYGVKKECLFLCPGLVTRRVVASARVPWLRFSYCASGLQLFVADEGRCDACVPVDATAHERMHTTVVAFFKFALLRRCAGVVGQFVDAVETAFLGSAR